MSWKVFRRVWVTICNLLFIGFAIFGLLDEYRLYQLSGPIKPPSTLSHALVSVFLIALLSLGIASEWSDWTWLAVSINAGFFAFLGFGVLGKAALMVLTQTPAQYHPEASLAVAIVGVPCGAIAVGDFLLYWITRPNRVPPPHGSELT